MKLPAFDDSLFDDSKTSLCYEVCSSGCTNDLYNSGIIDTAEEIAWVNNCNGYAAAIDNFWESNNEPEIAQTLLAIAMFGYLTYSDFSTLVSAIAVYLDDPATTPYAEVTLSFVQEKNFDRESIATSETISQLIQNNLLFDNYSESDWILADEIIGGIHEECCLPTYQIENAIALIQEYAYQRQKWIDENSGQTFGNLIGIRLYLVSQWKVLKGTVHTALDLCGLIPAAGEPCDVVNGVLYTIEGDGINATLSFASTIPFIGTVAVGKKYYNAYKVGNESFKLTLEVGQSLYKFGSRNKLKKLLKPGANEEAHHMITWARNDHGIVQLAAQKGWHPSHTKNGINLDKSIHNGWDAAHSIYSSNLKAHLDNAFQNGVAATPQAAKDFLEALQTSIRTQFENGSKLDEIIF